MLAEARSCIIVDSETLCELGPSKYPSRVINVTTLTKVLGCLLSLMALHSRALRPSSECGQDEAYRSEEVSTFEVVGFLGLSFKII